MVHTDVSEQLDDKQASITVEDSAGNMYTVDTKTGKATSIGKNIPGGSFQTSSIPTSLSSGKGEVTFEPLKERTVYGFDIRDKQYSKSSMFMEEYKTLKKDDGSLYDIPVKLIPTGHYRCGKGKYHP